VSSEQGAAREDHDDYVAVAAADELWDGEMESYDIDGAEILLVRLAGQYHAYDGSCPHQGQPLVEGDLDGVILTCAAHEWMFDVSTGQGVNPRTVTLARHDVRIAEGAVLVSREPRGST
jgi:nitrite reductase/ring-hydroxylating ferredoxin subunit